MDKRDLPTTLGIFIFYHKPDDNYLNTLRNFLELSLGLTKLYTYVLSEYPKFGLYDIMEDVVLEIRNLRQSKFHNVIVYLENTLIYDCDLHREMLWFRLFDVIIFEYVIILYKDTVDFEKPLFKYELVSNESEIMINHNTVEAFLINKFIVIDNYSIEEFCHNILETVADMDMFQFLIERRFDINNSVIYCNFIPSNVINLFYNYKYYSLSKVSDSDIIPIFVSALGHRLLNIFYKELKSGQKKRLLSYLV